MRIRLLGIFLCGVLSACASVPVTVTGDPGNPGEADTPDVRVQIDGLGPCHDGPDRTLRLDSKQPLNILVHGCRGSAGRFRALAEVLAFHGQQSACFSYDDREHLMASSGRLAAAIERVAEQMPAPKITLLGHSLGGLVARKSLVVERADGIRNDHLDLRLVTISAPFAGIESANPCANPALRALTLGLNDLACWLISGDKWFDITSASTFIRQPGRLVPQVSDYLKVATDERGTCRAFNADRACIEDDYVFSLAEQRHPFIDARRDVTTVDVAAGHVEIVGESGVKPLKLIRILQDHGVVKPTPPSRADALRALLSQLY